MYFVREVEKAVPLATEKKSKEIFDEGIFQYSLFPGSPSVSHGVLEVCKTCPGNRYNVTYQKRVEKHHYMAETLIANRFSVVF